MTSLTTCNDVLLQAVVVGCTPLTQSVESHIVGLKLTVRVCKQSTQVRNDLGGSAVKGSQKHAPGVVVVSMDVVPDDRGALYDRGHFLQVLDGQLF